MSKTTLNLKYVNEGITHHTTCTQQNFLKVLFVSLLGECHISFNCNLSHPFSLEFPQNLPRTNVSFPSQFRLLQLCLMEKTFIRGACKII